MSGLFTRDITTESVFGDSAYGWTPINGAGAVAIPAVYAAVSLIADQFAAAPMGTYSTAGKEVDALEPVAMPTWLECPDPFLNDNSEWRYQLATSLKLRGNAYGLVVSGPRGVSGVRWLHPDWVTVNESDLLHPRWYVNGKEHLLYASGGDLVHLREFIQPGTVVGLSPISRFKKTFETADFAQSYGNDWFRNSSVPSGLVAAKGRSTTPEQAAEARAAFVKAAKASQPVFLPGEWDYTKLTVTPEEAQFLATIKATATTIASIFRVSPEDIGGESGNSRTYSNREMDQKVFNENTLKPLTNRFEKAIGRLLPPSMVIRVDLESLAMPSMLERARVDTEELRNGSATLAEVRRRRGRKELTAAEIEAWQKYYSTTKSLAESISEATSVSTSITKAG